MDSKSFSHRTFLKIVMKFVFTGKGNLQKVKKIINNAGAELSCARPIRAGGQGILASVMFKLSKNPDTLIYSIRHKPGKESRGLTWGCALLVRLGAENVMISPGGF